MVLLVFWGGWLALAYVKKNAQVVLGKNSSLKEPSGNVFLLSFPVFSELNLAGMM